MKRFRLTTFLVLSAVLIGCALLVPAHFRAVDAAVIERAGRATSGGASPTLIEEGLACLSTEKFGPAWMIWRIARDRGLPQSEAFGMEIARFARAHPTLVALGGASPLLEPLNLGPDRAESPMPIMEVFARRGARDAARELLEASRRPGVQQLLLNRNLTNTVHFLPAATAGGPALEAAILTAALLHQGDFLTATFRDNLEWLALRANRGDNSESLELVYLDLLSLGRRLDWVSLAELMKHVDGVAQLREFAEALRRHGDATAGIYVAALLTGRPDDVATYLARFQETGLKDLHFALRSGRGAVELLAQKQQRIYHASIRDQVTGYDPFGMVFFGLVPVAVATPAGALVLKYSLLLFGAFFLARSVGMITSALNIQFGSRLAADGVFALALAFVIGVAIEPFVGTADHQNQFPVLFQFPNLAGATGAHLQQITKPYMNHLTIFSLVLFFVIQATIYVLCLMKLAEIRRQPVEARMKLKLLENEDLLFDAGLYIGFVGSVLALILMSIGVGKVSMMAYASTSFGIIFVSVLKIFHVRPLRRQLILESEAKS